MKLHLVTIGQPKLSYAKLGWEEYVSRLRHYHSVQITHIADKHNDSSHILATTADSFRVGLVIQGHELSSVELATWLADRALLAQTVSFIIGGPDGLPEEVRAKVDFLWSFSPLTLPHDLAMVVLAEALYRASSINAHTPYHK